MKELLDNLCFCYELKALFKGYAEFFELEKGEQLYCQKENNNNYFYFLLSGSMKFILRGRNNKEILLYRVFTPGVCLVNGFIPQVNLHIEPTMISTENSVFMKIPNDKILKWSAIFEELKEQIDFSVNFHFNSLSTSLLSYVSIPSDQRLYDYLIVKSKVMKSKAIEVSVKEISKDLNLARETVSRFLKKFERESKIIKMNTTILLLDVE